jgi:hypothetical protein
MVPNKTKSKLKNWNRIESSACNQNNFEILKIWSENPRVGSSILSLGTVIMKSLLETAGFFYVPILSVDLGVIIAYYML